MDHPILARNFDLVLINKEKIVHLVYFSVSVDHKVKVKESKKISKKLDLARELKEPWNMKEGYDNINSNWHVWNGPKSLGKETGRIEDQRKS